MTDDPEQPDARDSRPAASVATSSSTPLAIVGRVRSDAHLERARVAYVEMLTAFGMPEEEAEAASSKAAEVAPLALVRRFGSDGYCETFGDWELVRLPDCLVLSCDPWRVKVGRSTGRVTVSLNDLIVHRSSMRELTEMPMLRRALEIARSVIVDWSSKR